MVRGTDLGAGTECGPTCTIAGSTRSRSSSRSRGSGRRRIGSFGNRGPRGAGRRDRPLVRWGRRQPSRLGPDNVAHVFFLAAFVNPGATSALMNRPLPLLEAIVRDGDRCSFDPKFAQAIFYGDSAPDVVANHCSSAPPDGPRCHGHAGGAPNSPQPCRPPMSSAPVTVPSRRTRNPRWQNRWGRVIVWPTDHSPFLTRPADVADLLT